MQNKRHRHQRTVAHAVGEQAEENDGQPEPPEATAGDRAQFGLSEAKLAAPIVQDAAANREADASGDQRDKAGQKQTSLAGRAGVRRAVHGSSRWFDLALDLAD